jgi:putative Ca2+/H+ antiporter (TMEM165/GDT1 family)
MDALDPRNLLPERRGVGAIPRQIAGDGKAISRAGAFTATLVTFFLAEIGDKTQIATIGLAARFELFYPVVIGTTLGMMLANIPAVIIGDRIADRLPVRGIRVAAAVVFAILGVVTLAGGGV